MSNKNRELNDLLSKNSLREILNSLWEIFIDDVEGELAMVKIDHGDGTPVGGRTIEVVALEEVASLIESKQKKIDELNQRLCELEGVAEELNLVKVDKALYKKKLQDSEKKVTELSWDGSLNKAEEDIKSLKKEIERLETENINLRGGGIGSMTLMKMEERTEALNEVKDTLTEISTTTFDTYCEQLADKALAKLRGVK